MTNHLVSFLLTSFVVITVTRVASAKSPVKDPHSFARPEEVVVTHLNLDISVDFERKSISGKASLQINNIAKVKSLYLDSRDLTVERVTLDDSDTSAVFRFGEEVNYLGRVLIIDILPETKVVHILYFTIPGAAALQWLGPAQTAGGKLPFLYTQSQSVYARTWIPCQDSPSVRMTYDATVKVPEGMMAVMSATNVTGKLADGIYHFRMPQRVPPYLLALGVGDLEFRSTGKRSGVYAERPLVEKAAWEFADTERMIEAAEELYGPYRWDRYDLLVLPPSFPFGGMENPRLTFVTPNVIVGDRSLMTLIAHELAHSWSGNLVTNATWNDFWLNEGFTSYAEHRIMEKLYGKEYDEMLSVLNFQDLQAEMKQQSPRDTCLRADFAGRSPDDAVTRIPYQKGQFFLRTIEQAVGREKFDAFLRSYFDHYAFQSITTDDFLEYLQKNLIRSDEKLEDKLQIPAWIDAPGIPNNVVKVQSMRFQAVDKKVGAWAIGTTAKNLTTAGWSTHEWLRFIRALPERLSHKQMADLDAGFDFSDSQNAEISYQWLLCVIQNSYEPAYPTLERFLTGQGRRKFLKPLYEELAKTPDGMEMALRIYRKARPTYHFIAVSAVDRILHWQD